MAQILPTLTTYSDTTLQKRTITDVVSIISPRDTPLIANLGGLTELPASSISRTRLVKSWSGLKIPFMPSLEHYPLPQSPAMPPR